MCTFRITGIFTIGIAILLAACTSAATPVTIQFTTKPEVAQAGNVEMNCKVFDPAGQPLSGADVDVIADHTEMDGMTMPGKATEQSKGQSAIQANFSMAGKWKVTVRVQKDNLDDKQDIDLQVK